MAHRQAQDRSQRRPGQPVNNQSQPMRCDDEAVLSRSVGTEAYARVVSEPNPASDHAAAREYAQIPASGAVF